MADKENYNISENYNLIEMIKGNEKRLQHLEDDIAAIRNYIKWQRIISTFNFFIIIVPVIIGFIYLPPIIKGFIDTYLPFLEGR